MEPNEGAVPAPDTVTEALAFLASQGYVDEFAYSSPGCVSSSDVCDAPVATASVDFSFRFEGQTDPADEAIVIGLRWEDPPRKGVLVSAFGADADPEHAALLVALARNAQ